MLTKLKLAAFVLSRNRERPGPEVIGRAALSPARTFTRRGARMRATHILLSSRQTLLDQLMASYKRPYLAILKANGMEEFADDIGINRETKDNRALPSDCKQEAKCSSNRKSSAPDTTASASKPTVQKRITHSLPKRKKFRPSTKASKATTEKDLKCDLKVLRASEELAARIVQFGPVIFPSQTKTMVITLNLIPNFCCFLSIICILVKA